jgi:hypothetical protein
MWSFVSVLWSWVSQNSAGIAAVAAIAQLVVAVLIWKVTRRYVRLTGDLVKGTENLVTASKDQLIMQARALQADLYERRLKL